MATQDQSQAHDADADALDALFGYSTNDDILASINETAAQPNANSTTQASNNDLGINEEVTVKKARKPAPKLDEERLLSQLGIPKLRRITKDRLRFKGKGHEFGDVGRLLNLYQLWLDDLYPKAKFADGVLMIEKLGHSKRMRMMRRTWIDEGKPKEREEERELVLSREEEKARDTDEIRAHETGQDDSDERPEAMNVDDENFGDGLFVKDNNGGTSTFDEALDEDELDMLLAETPGGAVTGNAASHLTADHDDVPDELDDLLAGEPGHTTAKLAPIAQPQRSNDEDFADEMEAMNNM